MRISVIDHTNNRKYLVELPEHIPMNRLIPVLAQRLQLPAQQNGQNIVYHLDHEQTGRRLDNNDTLETAGVRQDELLRLFPEITAATPVHYRRLLSDQRELLRLVERSPYISVKTAKGNPPDEYVLSFKVKGIAKIDSRQHPVFSFIHEVYIDLRSPEYPRKAPFLRWQTPIFHPNVSSEGLGVCVDLWYASRTFESLVIMLGRMIQYQNYNPLSALNRAAANWSITYANLLPIGLEQLRGSEPENQQLGKFTIEFVD